jgi:hypothetical protein
MRINGTCYEYDATCGDLISSQCLRPCGHLSVCSDYTAAIVRTHECKLTASMLQSEADDPAAAAWQPFPK